jgi:SOS-response transcriptional repressor LexA
MAEKKAKKSRNSYKDLLEIIGAFVVAFVFYQLLIFTTGTKLPIVSVVSDSMYHTGPFDSWWNQSGKFYEDRHIGRDQFLKFTDFNGLSKGDLLFVVKADDARAGDIVIYQRAGNSMTIVHRIIEINNENVVTKGDNNLYPDQPILKANIQGKVVFAIPVLGYPRFLLHMVGI